MEQHRVSCSDVRTKCLLEFGKDSSNRFQLCVQPRFGITVGVTFSKSTNIFLISFFVCLLKTFAFKLRDFVNAKVAQIRLLEYIYIFRSDRCIARSCIYRFCFSKGDVQTFVTGVIQRKIMLYFVGLELNI